MRRVSVGGIASAVAMTLACAPLMVMTLDASQPKLLNVVVLAVRKRYANSMSVTSKPANSQSKTDVTLLLGVFMTG